METLNNLYSSKCIACGGAIALPDLTGQPFDDVLDDIARRLYSAKMKVGEIDPALYKKTADELMSAMYEGLGGTSFGYTDPKNTLSAYLAENIHKFSAAKSLAEQMEFSQLLIGNDGTPRSFIDFRNAMFEAGHQFNVNWLKTEYETAFASAQMAQQWENLKHNEVLEYSTVGDNRVRPAHAALDGLTLSADSPVWNKIWPPCDWLCRCTVVPGVASNLKTDSEGEAVLKNNPINPAFEFNPGKEKIVFKDEHPYYKTIGKELDAVKNYGLPSVKKIYSQNLPALAELSSKEQYFEYWKNMPKVPGTDDIVIKDKLGINILFDSVSTPGNSRAADRYFKDHILKRSNEERWKYGNRFSEVIKEPDEIWTERHEGIIIRKYIKFFSEKPLTIWVTDKRGVLTAETMYNLTENRATEMRRGVLLYVKK